jgi:hypothetical protein
VAPDGEAELGAVAPGAGPVQVEGRGRVGDVLAVGDQEVAGGVLAIEVVDALAILIDPAFRLAC